MDAYANKVMVLFSIQDNQVVLQKKGRDEIVKQRSIFVTSDSQLEVGQDLIKFRDLFNSINSRVGGGLKMQDIFMPDLRPNGETDPVSLNHDVVKLLLGIA